MTAWPTLPSLGRAKDETIDRKAQRQRWMARELLCVSRCHAASARSGLKLKPLRYCPKIQSPVTFSDEDIS
jgi:hypothetical protein